MFIVSVKKNRYEIESFPKKTHLIEPMQHPENTKIVESELATFWFDENGILYGVAKKTKFRTLKMQKENFAFLKQLTANKKVCLIADSTNGTPPNTEIREYIEKESQSIFKAIAIISKSAVGEIYPKAFLILNNYDIPIQFFAEETTAKEWLKQYL